VLTGVVAALLARRVRALEAGALGAYVHGLAGDLVAAEKGHIGMVAGDVLELLPNAFREVEAAGQKRG
jgi:NAD(P)H-hydrate repair Nnr-like enzyme with NAD(P)H-hydrate dehydratase domain